MNKEFIPYEEALKLKDLGFDKCCLGYYVGGVLGQFKPASFYEISEDEIVLFIDNDGQTKFIKNRFGNI